MSWGLSLLKYGLSRLSVSLRFLVSNDIFKGLLRYHVKTHRLLTAQWAKYSVALNEWDIACKNVWMNIVRLNNGTKLGQQSDLIPTISLIFLENKIPFIKKKDNMIRSQVTMVKVCLPELSLSKQEVVNILGKSRDKTYVLCCAILESSLSPYQPILIKPWHE